MKFQKNRIYSSFKLISIEKNKNLICPAPTDLTSAGEKSRNKSHLLLSIGNQSCMRETDFCVLTYQLFSLYD